MKDLGLEIEKSVIFPFILEVFAELQNAGLSFRPRLYFGDEWFSPEGVMAVAIPFFLAHPRLQQLEKKMVMECEGETEKSFKRYFRHELGHAFDHAFQVSKKRSWVKLFGSPKTEYHPETYRPRPYSKNFVQNIPHWYAQAHPDEDFAETFAVWLDPDSRWKTKFRGWGAYKKLEYVHALAEEFKGRTVPIPSGRMISDASRLTTTLKNYYSKKRKDFAENYPNFYDDDLLRIFAQRDESLASNIKAYAFMKKYQRSILNSVSRWTGERKITIEQLLVRLSVRCRKLNLYLQKSEEETALELASYLATLVSNYLFTGHFKRSV